MYAFQLISSGRYLIAPRHYTCDLEKAKLWDFWNYDVALGYKECLSDMGIQVNILTISKSKHGVRIIKTNNQKQ